MTEPFGSPEAHVPAAKPERAAAAAFDALKPREQDIDLARAQVMLEMADERDVALNAKDMAVLLGYEKEGPFARVLDKVKAAAPFLKSHRQKWRKTMGGVRERAEAENEERDEAKRFSSWIDGLPDDALAHVKMTSETAGDAMAETPVLAAAGAGGAARSFSLDRLLNVPEAALAKLPPDVRADLDARRAFWQEQGVGSGPELRAFFADHFARTPLVFDGKKDPVELAWLASAFPDDAAFLQRLHARGAAPRLVACTASPPAVLESVRHIAKESQHAFVSTWLPDLVREGVQPVVSPSDRKAVRERYESRAAAARAIERKAAFRGRLIGKRFGEEAVRTADFDASVRRIAGFAPLYLSLEADGAALSPEDRARLRDINRRFDEGIGDEYAKRKLLFDDADGVSEGAQTIVKAMAVVGPVAHVMEDTFHLPGIAKFLAASSDDLMSEWAEISALRGAGISWEEIRGRFKTLAPAAGAAFALAGAVGPVREHVGERAAGAVFSTAAVFLSAVTSVLSVKLFAEQYGDLAREGKLRAYYPGMDERQRKDVERAAARLDASATPEAVWAAMEETFRRLGASDGEVREHREAFERFAASKETRAILDGLREPSFLKRYAAGAKETMGINPARFGIAMGSFTSPLFGFAAGPAFLSRPFLYALAGSYESAAGVGSIIGYKKIFPLLWRRFVRRRTGESLRGVPAAKRAPRPAPARAAGGGP